MNLEKSTVLYIDDEPINLQVFCANFDEFYHIITLSSTFEAAEVIKSNNVKVIITDQRMPSETGIEFVKRINSDYPDIIKILLTAYSDKDTVLDAINEVNIYKYLLKPWKRQDVKDTIDSAIREYDLKYEKSVLLKELQKKNEDLISAYKMLEANERKFRTVFSNSNDGIYILNQDNEVFEANQAFLRLIGFDNETASMNDLSLFIKHKFPEIISKPLELSGQLNSSIAEMEICPGTQENKFLEINSNRITYEKDTFILSIMRDITERRMFEKKIIETIIQTQEEEQSRYARELHDGLGPLLSTLKMHLEWISNPENSKGKDKIIQHIIQTINLAISTTKEISNNLSPHILERFGLVNALSSYVDNLKETGNVNISISSNFTKRLDNKLEIAVYRSVLECINNSIKHSCAKKINVQLIDQVSYIIISVSDDGKGFDVLKENSSTTGMGLLNIKTRIKHLNGNIKFDSKIGSGTNITITIPIN